MRRLLSDAVRTLVPPRDDRHGPLPPLMLTLTVVTGLVDAVSYLALGKVFVANMTGNLVFLGFALAGAEGLSAVASSVAVVALLLGALVGAVLLLHAHLVLVLGLALLLLTLTSVVTHRLSAGDPAWTRPGAHPARLR